MLIRSIMPYRHGRIDLEGYFAWDDAVQGRRPAVLLVHEFTGPGPHIFEKADRLAAAGFAAFAVDMYGYEFRPRNRDEARRMARIFKANRLLMRERVQVGMKAMLAQPQVDPQRLLALGYSFGGCAVLELARSGAPLRGTVSVYGFLATSHPAVAGTIQGRMMAIHGARDKVVPMAEVEGFALEMETAGIAYDIQVYPEAGHGFANRDVETDPVTDSGYCQPAAHRAWRDTLRFFAETA